MKEVLRVEIKRLDLREELVTDVLLVVAGYLNASLVNETVRAVFVANIGPFEMLVEMTW